MKKTKIFSRNRFELGMLRTRMRDWGERKNKKLNIIEAKLTPNVEHGHVVRWWNIENIWNCIQARYIDIESIQTISYSIVFFVYDSLSFHLHPHRHRHHHHRDHDLFDLDDRFEDFYQDYHHQHHYRHQHRHQLVFDSFYRIHWS